MHAWFAGPDHLCGVGRGRRRFRVHHGNCTRRLVKHHISSSHSNLTFQRLGLLYCIKTQIHDRLLAICLSVSALWNVIASC